MAPLIRSWLSSRAILLVVGAVAVAFLVGSFVFARDETEDAKGQTAATAAQAQGFASQIQDACAARQLAGPICSQAADVAADPIPGPTPAQDGTDGTDGVNGANGVNGTNGADGDDGIDGQDGSDGVDGADGDDGAAGGDGADGVDGSDGQDGVDGAPGTPGQPPAGFSWSAPDGTAYFCPRDPASPDMAAFYPCQITSTPAPTTEPTPTEDGTDDGP